MAVSVFAGHAHHQIAVAHLHAQRAADGETQFLHPAAAQAEGGRALAVDGVAAADGAGLRRAWAAGGREARASSAAFAAATCSSVSMGMSDDSAIVEHRQWGGLRGARLRGVAGRSDG